MTATVKPVISSHLNIDKTKVFKTNYSLMKMESIAECSPLKHSAILLTCIKRFIISHENKFVFFNGFTVGKMK